MNRVVMKRHRVLIRRPALERAQPQSYISTCSVRGSGLLELKPGRGRSQKCDLQTSRERDETGPSPGGDRMARDGGIITRISRPDLQFLRRHGGLGWPHRGVHGVDTRLEAARRDGGAAGRLALATADDKSSRRGGGAEGADGGGAGVVLSRPSPRSIATS